MRRVPAQPMAARVSLTWINVGVDELLAAKVRDPDPELMERWKEQHRLR